MDVITYALAKKYADEQMKNIPGYLEAIRNELKAIQDIMTLERSDPIIQIGQIDSLGGSVAPGVVGGVVDMNVKGRTGSNVIKEGNFPDGATKWFAGGGTLSVANNTATSTGNGVVLAPEIYQDTDIEAITGKEVFIRFKAKVTNAATPNIIVHLRGSIGGNVYSVINQSNAIQNQEYTIYDIVTITSVLVGKIQLRILHAYADPAEANGKSMEVQEVLTKDLTAEGLTGKTADGVHEMFSDWFDGTQSSGPKRMKVVGKNLVNMTKHIENILSVYEDRQIIGGNGGLYTINPAYDNLTVPNNYLVKSNTNYTISGIVVEGGTFNIEVLDAVTGQVLVSGVFAETTFNTGASNLINVKVYATGKEIIDIQLEEGTTATARETYKESLAYTNQLLRSLPNGVADKVDVNEGIKTKNVEEYVLQSGDITNFSNHTNNSLVYISYTNFSDYININTVDTVATSISTSRTTPRNGVGSFDDIESRWTHYNHTTQFMIVVPLGTYANLAAAQADLIGTVIYYQLAEPIPIQLNIPPQSLLSFENGTLLQEHVIGEVTFYGANCPVDNVKYPIEELDFIRKVDQTTGEMVDLDTGAAIVAPDGLSFTHMDLSVGDLVDWDYYYSSELSTLAELEYTVPLANLKSTITRTQQVVTKAADYTVAADDYIILADGSTTAVNITLPTLLVAKNLNYKIKAVNITNVVKVITEGTETIDGAVDYTFSTANEVVEVVGDGANWVIV